MHHAFRTVFRKPASFLRFSLLGLFFLAGCGGGGGSSGNPAPPDSVEPPIAVGQVVPRPEPVKTAGMGDGQGLPDVAIDGRIDDLAAFTRIAHNIQYFHPSDGVADTNWDEFLEYGMYVVASRPANTPLAETLKQLFSGMAPSVRFNPSGPSPDLGTGNAVVGWFHRGYRDRLKPAAETLHSNQRRILDRRQIATDTGGPTQTHSSYAIQGITVEQPLIQTWRNGRSEPESKGFRVPAQWKLATEVENRYLCLAAAAKTWGTLNTFFPYFDVLPVNWQDELPGLLRSCAVNEQRTAALKHALSLALTKLQDNHMALGLNAREAQSGVLPVYIQPLENRFVVLPVLPYEQTIKAGDEVTHINRVPVHDHLANLKATSLHNDHLFADNYLELFSFKPPGTSVHISLINASGVAYDAVVSVNMTDEAFEAFEAVYDTFHFTSKTVTRWLDNDILLINLSEATRADMTGARQEMAKAKGVVFDLRRYPQAFEIWQLFAQFKASDIQSLPLRAMTPFVPEQPSRKTSFEQKVSATERSSIPAIVLSSRSSQSFNEHMLGYAQSAGLPILGERTSGANGDVSYIFLSQCPPFVVRFTGLEVRQHDGSQFHAVGIKPDIVLARTLQGLRQGKDEQLEAAHRYIKNKLAN